MRPNILVFFTDQQRWDTMGLHGNPLDLTPNLDRLAQAGTFLPQAFTCQPVCGPARACLQTGLFATRHGSITNGVPLNPELPSLGKLFSSAGYQTAYFGKWHLAKSRDGAVDVAERGGYEYWLASNVLEFTSDAFHTRLWNHNNEPVDLPGYRVDALTDSVIRFLDRDRDRSRPFLSVVSFIEPHHQNHQDDYPAPPGYRERYTGRWMPPDLAALKGSAHHQIAGYFGMVKRLDEALGRLMDAMRSLDLERDTVVVFLSDHGCHFKTRNGEYKRSCHESSIRIPAAIWGGPFEGGGRFDRPVSLVDFAPTLLDTAGISVPEEMQGRSILRALRDRETPWPDEAFVQISENHVGRAIRTKRWKYAVKAPDRDPQKDPGSEQYVETELYDLECDPYELHNLVGLQSHRALSDHLRDRLIRRMVEAGESAPEIVPAPSRPSGQRRVDPWELV